MRQNLPTAYISFRDTIEVNGNKVWALRDHIERVKSEIKHRLIHPEEH